LLGAEPLNARFGIEGQGQLVCGSFMDYAMPRAGDFTGFTVAFEEVLCSPIRWASKVSAKRERWRVRGRSSTPFSRH
jgi:hypothetical protein